MTPSFTNDLALALFSPKRFYQERFLTIDKKRIGLISFLASTAGFLCCGITLFVLSYFVKLDFISQADKYQEAIKILDINQESFMQMISVQQSFGFLLAVFSWLIALSLSHLFGGALYIFIRLFARFDTKIDYSDLLDCVKMAQSSMAFYAIIAIGPLIALIFFSLNCYRALKMRFNLGLLTSIFSIASALYMSLFLAALSFQELAIYMSIYFRPE